MGIVKETPRIFHAATVASKEEVDVWTSLKDRWITSFWLGSRAECRCGGGAVTAECGWRGETLPDHYANPGTGQPSLDHFWPISVDLGQLSAVRFTIHQQTKLVLQSQIDKYSDFYLIVSISKWNDNRAQLASRIVLEMNSDEWTGRLFLFAPSCIRRNAVTSSLSECTSRCSAESMRFSEMLCVDTARFFVAR